MEREALADLLNLISWKTQGTDLSAEKLILKVNIIDMTRNLCWAEHLCLTGPLRNLCGAEHLCLTGPLRNLCSAEHLCLGKPFPGAKP
jgi:hypothetical protein